MVAPAHSSALQSQDFFDAKIRSELRTSADKRTAERFQTTFITCSLESKSGAQLGVIRNISETGVMIESRLPVQVGERVKYKREPYGSVWAKVVWTKDGRMGLENESPVPFEGPKLSFRAVRIPLCRSASLWLGDREFPGWLVNISQSGVLMELDAVFMPKRLVTLTMGEHTFPNTMIARVDGVHVGARFASKLTRNELTDILDRSLLPIVRDGHVADRDSKAAALG
jgi:hypothetical protein